MGLFSGKRRTTVKAVAQRMLSDDNFKYGTQQAVSRWIWENGGKPFSLENNQLSDYLYEASKSGLPKRWDKLYRYARKPDRYIFGLPTSHLSEFRLSDIKEAVSDYLAHDGIREKDIYATWFSDKDFYMTAWLILVNQYGYDSQTNELTLLSEEKGTPCYLYDGYLTVSERTHADYENIGFDNRGLSFSWGEIPNAREKDTSREQTTYQVTTEDGFVISYVYGNKEETLSLNLSFVNPIISEEEDTPDEYQYVYAIYTKEDKYYFFEYTFGSGEIIEIDTAIRIGESFGEYYPKIYLRINQKDVVTSTDKLYKEHLKKSLRYIDQDAEVLTEQLKDSIGDNYNDVRGMYIFLGARINESNEDSAVAEYCFRYFKRLHDLNSGKGVSQIIADNVSEHTLYCSQIVYTRKQGKLTDVSKFTMQKGTEELTEENSNVYRKTKDAYYHELIYQLNETEYESLKCYELLIDIKISGYSYTHTREDSDLIIPIDRALVKELSQKEKELLFHKSLHLQLLLVKVTKQKWYETSIFRVTVAVVGVALSVVFAPAGAGVLATLQATAINAVKAMAIAYAVNKVLDLAVKAGLIDLKTATILSMVASIVLSAHHANFDMSKILTAPNIMKNINNAFDTYNKLMMIEIQDTQKKMVEFNLLVKDREKQLLKAQKLLDTKVFDLDLELLKSNYSPNVDLFESVEMFYSRHHSFNVIGLSHGLISEFVDGTLQPKPNLLLPASQSVDEIMLDVLLV